MRETNVGGLDHTKIVWLQTYYMPHKQCRTEATRFPLKEYPSRDQMVILQDPCNTMAILQDLVRKSCKTMHRLARSCKNLARSCKVTI